MSLFEHIDENGIAAPVVEPVVEPTTDNQTVEPVVPEQTTEPVVPVQVVEVKAPYTNEEIAELIHSDGDIDTSRLSPEGQALMKAMQRGFTPKLQEAAELKKELARIREEFEAAKPKQPPKDIYEAYDQDPDGVLKYVNNAIRELAEEGSVQSIAKIEELRDLKDQFRQRQVSSLQTEQTKQREVIKVMAAITEAVPDISTKQVALRDFALDVLGMTPEELAVETDPAKSGMQAAVTVARINRAYDKFYASQTAKQKIVKPAPTPVEQPGNGYEPKQPTISDKKKEAIATGNFRNFFLELGDS